MYLRYQALWSVSLTVLCLVGLAGCPGTEKGGVARPEPPVMKDTAGCEGAVLPDLKTIESGEYTPLSRPLFMYVNNKALQKPEVAGYLKFVLNEAQDSMVHFIKLDAKTLKDQRDKLKGLIADVKIPEKLESGTVAIDGSSTVFPFSAGAAKGFEDANDKKVRVTVGKKGTGGGFERFCAGETDISNASRPIKSSEMEEAKKHEIEFTEFMVCIDGITVCVNPKNDWCYCLSVEQLKSLWEPGSKVKMWKDLDPKWPDKEIKLFGPDTDSGTFDYFTEVIVGKSKAIRSDYSPSAEDNTLVRGVAGETYGLGYFGYSYYDNSRKQLRPLGIKPAAKKSEAKKADEKKPEAETK